MSRHKAKHAAGIPPTCIKHTTTAPRVYVSALDVVGWVCLIVALVTVIVISLL